MPSEAETRLEELQYIQQKLRQAASDLQDPRYRVWLSDSSYLIQVRRALRETVEMEANLLSQVRQEQAVAMADGVLRRDAALEEEKHRNLESQSQGNTSAETAKVELPTSADAPVLPDEAQDTAVVEWMDKIIHTLRPFQEKAMEDRVAAWSTIASGLHQEWQQWMADTIVHAPPPEIAGMAAAMSSMANWAATQEQLLSMERELTQLESTEGFKAKKAQGKLEVVEALLADVATLEEVLFGLQLDQEERLDKVATMRKEAEEALDADSFAKLQPLREELQQEEDQLAAEEQRTAEVKDGLEKQYHDEAERQGVLALEEEVARLRLELEAIS